MDLNKQLDEALGLLEKALPEPEIARYYDSSGKLLDWSSETVALDDIIKAVGPTASGLILDLIIKTLKIKYES